MSHDPRSLEDLRQRLEEIARLPDELAREHALCTLSQRHGIRLAVLRRALPLQGLSS